MLKRNAAKLKEFKSLQVLLKSNDVDGAFVNGYSYGEPIDSWIASNPSNHKERFSNPSILAKMLNAARIDYMLTAPEEVGNLIATNKLKKKFATQIFNDTPPGNSRYLMCGAGVPASLIKKFNKAWKDSGPNL